MLRLMLGLKLSLLLLAHAPHHSHAGRVETTNADAIARRASRKEWRRAWPIGCREYAGRKDAKGRFCSLTAPASGRKQASR